MSKARGARATGVRAAAALLSLHALAAVLFAAGIPWGAGAAFAQSLGEPTLARVILPEQAFVEGDVIRLGDIARVEAADPRLAERLRELEVGRAALPGQSRSLTVGTLRLRMRQARLPERAVEIVAERDPVEVITRYQVIAREQLEAAVTRWYFRHAAVPEGAELKLEVSVEPQWAPVGPVQIEVALAEPKLGNVAVPLEIVVDGRPYKRVNASVKAYVEQEVWVAARPVLRGETIGPADATRATRMFAQPVAGPVDLAVPVRAKRYVREGTPLTWDVVEPVPDVHRGDRVTLVAAVGGIVVQVPGEALSEGRIGDVVTVRNLTSGNVVYGTLDEDGIVWVSVW